MYHTLRKHFEITQKLGVNSNILVIWGIKKTNKSLTFRKENKKIHSSASESLTEAVTLTAAPGLTVAVSF